MNNPFHGSVGVQSPTETHSEYNVNHKQGRPLHTEARPPLQPFGLVSEFAFEKNASACIISSEITKPPARFRLEGEEREKKTRVEIVEQ